MEEEKPVTPSAFEQLNERQRAFVLAYLDCLNATKAARKAGYSEESVRSIGSENLTKPNIIAAISEIGEQMAAPSGELMKHLTDVVRTRLNDFMVVREVQGYEQGEQYVTVLLEHTKEELDTIQDFMKTNVLTEDQQKPFLGRIARLQELCIDYQLDILRYGNEVTRLAKGRPCMVKVADLDLVAIAEAYDLGRIKSYSVTKDNIRVEMHDMITAADKLLQLHGRYKQLPGGGGTENQTVYLLPDGTPLKF